MDGLLMVAAAWIIAAGGVHGRPQGTPPKVALRDVGKFVGADVTVCGRVTSYDCSRSQDTVLLKLDEPSRSGVSIGVPSIQRQTFGERLEDACLWTSLCATGRVAVIDGKYVVLVDQPSALVVNDGGVRPEVLSPPDAVHGCGVDIQLPKVLHERKPHYTADAMRARIEGSLLLDAVVLRDGSVGAVRVVRSLDADHGLDQEAIAAVRQWRFAPGRQHGQVVPMIVTIELTFTTK